MRKWTLALLLLSCSPYKTYETPEIQTKAMLQIDGNALISEAEPIADWWYSFQDPYLATLVKEAFCENHDIRKALSNLEQARAYAKLVGLAHFPDADSSLSYSRELRSNEAGMGKLPDRSYNLFDGSLNASWEIDLFGRIRSAMDEAAALYEASIEDLKGVYVSIAAEVASTYMELRGAQKRLSIAEKNAERQQQSFKLTEVLNQGGAGTSLDVARAEAQLNLTLSTIPIFKAASIRHIYRLSVLTGKEPKALLEKLGSLGPMPELPPSVPVGDAASLLRRRPDIAAAERRMAASIAEYNLTAADLFPKVSLLGSFGFSTKTLSRLGSNALTGSIGPSLSWRVFDLGRIRREMEQVDARASGLLASYEQTVLLSLEETQGALADFTHEREEYSKLSRAVDAAGHAAKLARQRYELGVDRLIDVLDAERTQLEAEDRQAESEIALATKLIAIYKALGGGWQCAPSFRN